MDSNLQVGASVQVYRKPTNLDPGGYMWNSSIMDSYIGSIGVITQMLDLPAGLAGREPRCPSFKVRHSDGKENVYPYSCLIYLPKVVSCTCKLVVLMTGGCKCGAFMAEKQAKKKKGP